MGQPRSMDLRTRVLAAIDAGASCRAAAARFGVAPATPIRWHAQRRLTGDVAPRPQGGDMRSRRVEASRDTIPALWEAHKDATLDELRVALFRGGPGGGEFDIGPLLRPPRHHAQKKTGHAIEQDRSDVLRQRQAWFDGQLDLHPERLVFIDETWTATNMARSHARCAKDERLRMGFPHGHRKTTTLVAGLHMTGMIAPMVLDEWFEANVAQVLVPELRPGDVVVRKISQATSAPK